MNVKEVERILARQAHVRTAGSREEAACAAVFADASARLGLDVRIESFPVKHYTEERSFLCADGREIPCRARLGSPNARAEGKLYYLSSLSETAMRAVRDCIVLTERPVGRELYSRLTSHGARGIIGTSGDCRDTDREIDLRPIAFLRDGLPLIPWVTVHLSDAIALVRGGARTAVIETAQRVSEGSSQNVVAELAGESDGRVVLSAHYDSTSLSCGAYDNLSGCIALLAIAEQLKKIPRRRTVRLLFCGAEEWGLLGSLAYCQKNERGEDRSLLNINLDMLGSTLGEFTAFSSADEETAEVLSRFGARRRFPLSARCGIRSSDSNSFVRAGVPAISFARYAPAGEVQIHTPRDVAGAVDPRRLLRDAEFIAKFTAFALNDPDFCDRISISEKIRGEVETYFKGKL